MAASVHCSPPQPSERAGKMAGLILEQQQSSYLTIAITFCKLLRPASLRSEDSSDRSRNSDRDQNGMLIGFNGIPTK
jgi:hypothetical protein